MKLFDNYYKENNFKGEKSTDDEINFKIESIE